MKLNYKQLSTEGQPLLILHGLFGSLDNWMTLGKEWSEHFQVFLIDQRNHGRSPHSDEFSYEAMAADLHEFIQDQGLEDVYLLGHSMGGKTVMEYATHYPGSVRKMVVVDIAPKSYPVHHDKIVEAMQSLDVTHTKSRSALDKALAEKLPQPDVRLFLLKNLYRTPEKTFAWRMNLPVLAQNLETISRRIESGTPIDVPALFVRGSDSHYVQDEDLHLIQGLFPQARLETLDAGHWVHAQRPEELFTLVNDFLRDA